MTVPARTQCCIAGGGPAGIMLGFLLARAGIDVIVLEKHADFFRDFRGDTIHPSTIQIMDELGLLDDFLKIPHTEARELSGLIGGQQIKIADFSRVPGRCKFIALMPQWDFLNFIAEHARAYPSFHLNMQAEATSLVLDGDRVTGVRATIAGVEREILADLTVAADGRRSTLRADAELKVLVTGAPMDVLWMRVSRMASDPDQTFGNVAAGGIFVMLNRNEYYQCAFIIPKGAFGEMKARGIEYLRSEIARIVPMLAGRIAELKSWDDVRLLTVEVDHLKTWFRPGLLCIGDAAHAMSPIGGVGVNLAVQDAVAAANILAGPLSSGTLTASDLQAVQARREPPALRTQGLQVFLQNRVITPVLRTTKPFKAPLLLRMLAAVPLFRRIPARVIGVGFRPEHVHTPQV